MNPASCSSSLCRRAIAPLVLCCLLFMPAAAADYQARSAELEKLRGQIERIERSISREQARKDKLGDELRTLERAVGAANSRLRELARQVERLNDRIEGLRQEHAAEEREAAEQRDYLSRQMLAAYVSGRQEYLRLMLNQEDPNRVDRLLVYYEYLNRARGERIQAAIARMQRLRELEERLAEERATLAETRRKQEQEQARLEQNRRERARVVAQVESEIAERGQELSRLQADERELERLLGRLQKLLADIPEQESTERPFSQSRGRLSWPVNAPVAARFGSSRGVGDSRWRGILLRGERGTDVRAVAHGRVVYADWLRGFGLLIILDHGEGFMTLYGHNEALYQDVGGWVRAGDVVAGVGASGGRNRAGLYFEVRAQGKPVDPLPWLRAR